MKYGVVAGVFALMLVFVADAARADECIPFRVVEEAANYILGESLAEGFMATAAVVKCTWNQEQQKCISDGCTGEGKQCFREIGPKGNPMNSCRCGIAQATSQPAQQFEQNQAIVR